MRDEDEQKKPMSRQVLVIMLLLVLNAFVVTGVFHITQRVVILLARAERAVAGGDFDVAEQLYREILEARPGNRQALLHLARILSWREQYPESIALYYELLGEPYEKP